MKADKKKKTQQPTVIAAEAQEIFLWNSYCPPGLWKFLDGNCNLYYTIVFLQPWPQLNLKVTVPNCTTSRNQINNEQSLSASNGK